MMQNVITYDSISISDNSIIAYYYS